jgi:CRP-like cAMP-binding protein
VLTESQKDAMTAILITEVFPSGCTIVHEGDPANSFYIIKNGCVRVTLNEKVIKKMVPP